MGCVNLPPQPQLEPEVVGLAASLLSCDGPMPRRPS